MVPILCFTGFNSDLTKNGQKMLEKCTEEMTKVSVWLVRCQQQNVTQWQHTKELEQLEKEINPLLGDKPQPALSYLLKKAVERMKEVPEVSQFELQNEVKKIVTCILQFKLTNFRHFLHSFNSFLEKIGEGRLWLVTQQWVDLFLKLLQLLSVLSLSNILLLASH